MRSNKNNNNRHDAALHAAADFQSEGVRAPAAGGRWME